MTSLFDLAGDALRLDRQITEAAQGLISDDPDEVAAATALLEGLISAEGETRQAIEAKADAWCWAVDRIRAQADARKAHADRLLHLALIDSRTADTLQEKLIQQLLILSPDATSFDLPSHRLKSRRSTSVEVEVDAWSLPGKFQCTKTAVSANKAAIKQALQAGQAVDGARLVERRSWSIG